MYNRSSAGTVDNRCRTTAVDNTERKNSKKHIYNNNRQLCCRTIENRFITTIDNTAVEQ